MEPGEIAKYDWRQDRRFAGCGVAAALLLNAAFGDNGGGYFTFLRIYVCGLAAILALLDWRRGRVWLPLSAILIAILFNPIRVIHMERSHWFWYNVGTAAWFAFVGTLPLLSNRRESLRGWSVAVLTLGLLGGSIVVGTIWRERNDANNTMNVDENLTTTDMNATTDLQDLNAAAAAAAKDAEAAKEAADAANAAQQELDNAYSSGFDQPADAPTTGGDTSSSGNEE